MRIYFNFPSYPHSKRATDLSHLAALFRTICVFVVLLGGLNLLGEGIQYIKFEDVAWVVGALVYLILYFTVIIHKIEDLARKDYAAAIKAAKENTVDKE